MLMLMIFVQGGEAGSGRGWQSRSFNQGAFMMMVVGVIMTIIIVLYREVDDNGGGGGVDGVGGVDHDSFVQGGREHNLPILVSRVTSNSPAAR